MVNEIKTTSRPPRRALRWVGLFFVCLLVGLFLLYFLGTSEWALKSVILPRVSKAMNGKVTVESANISPFSAVTMRGLKVETKGPDPLVTAREVRARYSLMDIIKGNINVSEVALDSPVITLVTFPDGTSNLDPLTAQKEPKEPKEKKPEKKSEKPPQVNLKKFALNNATVRKIDQRKDGTRQLLELTGVNVTADDIGNNKTGQLGLAANVRMDQGLNSASNGVLAATMGGKFNLTLDPALKPQVVKGQSQVDVTEAKGAFQQAAGLGVTLNTDLTPTQLNDVSVRFAQAGKGLGALTVSGPFNAQTMEGKLAVVLSQIDRQALNIAGAAMGVDFNQSTISSTNTVELTQRGQMIAVNGQLLVGSFSATTKGQTTPALDVHSAYALTYDQMKKTALVQTFTLNGTQNGAEFLRGTLAKPMLLELGKASGAMDESAFDLVVTNFNLPDWRAFLGTNINLASGRVGANTKLISRQAGKELSVTGNASVQELTGTVQSNRFDRFATLVDLDLVMRGPAVEIKKLTGSLQQSGQPGGAFDLAGTYHLTNQVGQITAKLTDLNQNVLKTFLAAALGDKQLESITINSTTTAQLGGPEDMAVKTEVHIANLVVNDPSGQVPRTPLALDATADMSKAKNVVDLRNVQLALTKTERAPNSLNVAGRIDMSKSNAWTGNLKVTSEGLDVTPYYDLFAKKSAGAKPAEPPRAPPPPAGETKPETEPAAVQLPFTQFMQEINIAKFFLREIAISNLVTKTTIENGRVTVDPASLTLNGGAVNLKALLNLAVAGYQYDLTATVADVPIEPLANTFIPEKKGQYKGTLLTSAKITGAGVTGPNLQKNLGGQLGLTLTNADIKVLDNPRLQKILRPIALAIRVPELANSPLSWVDAQVAISNGTINIPVGTAESSVFRAGLSGTITMAEVLTNSTLNKLPVDLALSRKVAERARLAPADLATNVQFVALPRFAAVAGTVGDPKPQIDSVAVGRILAGTIGNFVGGDAGKILRGLGNLGPGGGTNASGTNTANTNATGNLLQNLGGLLQKSGKTNATTTNAPAQKKNQKFNPLDLLK